MEFWIVFPGNQEAIRSFRQYKDTEHDNMWLIRPRGLLWGWQCPYLFSLICLADHLMMQSSAGGLCWVALYSPEAQSLSILRALNLTFRPLLLNGWSMHQYQQHHLGADKKYRVLGPILPYQTEFCAFQQDAQVTGLHIKAEAALSQGTEYWWMAFLLALWGPHWGRVAERPSPHSLDYVFTGFLWQWITSLTKEPKETTKPPCLTLKQKH